MLDRIAEMMHKSDDKSVLEAYCMPEDEHSRDDCVSQKDPLAPSVELGSRPVDDASIPSLVLKIKRVPPRRLALCGGGVRCVAHVGVFKAFESEGLLSCVKEILGISAGALFGMIYVCGYSLIDIERLALEFDFTVLRNIEPENIFMFPTSYGLDDGASLDKFLSSLLHRSGLNPDITFAELAEARPVAFRCFATDIQTAKVREFSATLTPNVKVRTGVRASMSLPILYTPVKDPLTGHLLMDGGVLHNLPLVFQTSREREETVAVLFRKDKDIKTIEGSHDLADIFQYVYDAMTTMRNEPYLKSFSEQIIRVSVKGLSTIHFEPTREQREDLIAAAEKDTRKFLYKVGKKPVRRFSVG